MLDTKIQLIYMQDNENDICIASYNNDYNNHVFKNFLA